MSRARCASFSDFRARSNVATSVSTFSTTSTQTGGSAARLLDMGLCSWLDPRS